LNKAINRLREVLRDSAEKPRFIETLPQRGYRFIARLESAAVGSATSALERGHRLPQPTPRIDSLAVLPLDNHSGDPAQDYFSDGMTEELISAISKIKLAAGNLANFGDEVQRNTQVFAAIAKELRVHAVVEGW